MVDHDQSFFTSSGLKDNLKMLNNNVMWVINFYKYPSIVSVCDQCVMISVWPSWTDLYIYAYNNHVIKSYDFMYKNGFPGHTISAPDLNFSKTMFFDRFHFTHCLLYNTNSDMKMVGKGNMDW